MGEWIPVSVEELERLPKFSKPPPETWNRLGKSVQKNVVICRRQVNLHILIQLAWKRSGARRWRAREWLRQRAACRQNS